LRRSCKLDASGWFGRITELGYQKSFCEVALLTPDGSCLG